MGFSWQEYWSGLLFSTPHVLCLVTQSCPTLCNPLDYIAHKGPLSMAFSRQEYWSGLPYLPPGGLPNPGSKPRSPALKVDSLPSEPQGKPKNTTVGRLSLLHGNFPTQQSNKSFLHYRWILCQMSYPGSPKDSHLFLLVAQSCLDMTAVCQASLSFTISRSLLKLMSDESVMLFNHLILCCPLL